MTARPNHREWPILTTDAFAAGLDLFVDDDTAEDMQNRVEAAMDRRGGSL